MGNVNVESHKNLVREQGLYQCFLHWCICVLPAVIAEASTCAIELRPAVDKLIGLDIYNTRTTRLKPLKLTDIEWSVLTQLRDILDYFLVATHHISQSSIPLLHQVIPFMDLLTLELENSLDNLTLHPAVHAGISRGIALLNKYYQKTDASIMYRMAMSKCPIFSLRRTY